MAWRELTRKDLTFFDDRPRDLVLEMTSLGWLGRMSKKGHAILRSPGDGTICISRKDAGRRSYNNALAAFERIKVHDQRG